MARCLASSDRDHTIIVCGERFRVILRVKGKPIGALASATLALANKQIGKRDRAQGLLQALTMLTSFTRQIQKLEPTYTRTQQYELGGIARATGDMASSGPAYTWYASRVARAKVPKTLLNFMLYVSKIVTALLSRGIVMLLEEVFDVGDLVCFRNDESIGDS